MFHTIPSITYHWIQEPKSLQETLTTEHANQWKAATDLDFETLMKNETWKLVELPSNYKPINFKWLFKVKYCNDGKKLNALKHICSEELCSKAWHRLFSLVVKFSSTRAAMAVHDDLLIHQIDIVAAFLNATLK